MSEYIVNKSKFVFTGEINIPPDKSISHRAVFLSSFNKNMTKITNLLISDDVKTTKNIVTFIILRTQFRTYLLLADRR